MQAAAADADPPEAEPTVPGAHRRKRAWEDDGSDGEAERERDRIAKEEFEERLKAKDEAKTRKIAEARLSKGEMEVSVWSLRELSGECWEALHLYGL